VAFEVAVIAAAVLRRRQELAKNPAPTAPATPQPAH
jgi:hypothetical protein